MLLKIAYNNYSEELISQLKDYVKKFPSVQLETFHEQVFKERKKAFAIKNEWGTKQSPFAILIDDNKIPVTAFYSERNECTLDKIIEVLKNYIIYGNKSN